VRPGSADQRLKGCFTSVLWTETLPLSNGPDIQAKSFCFTANGRITHDPNSYAASSDALVPGFDQQRSGNYRIDGNAVRIQYDNGAVGNISFGFLLDDNSSVSIVGVRFSLSP